MSKLWNADASTLGAPTSMDVLLHWLQSPGKYNSWQSEDRKLLTFEIEAQLKTHGISKRSPAAIRRKIFAMEKQYEAVSTWLKHEGKFELFLDGKSDKSVEEAVLRRCPMYRELTSVFHSASDAEENNENENQDDVGVENSNVSSVSLDAEEKTAEVPSAQGKRKRISSVLDDAEVDSKGILPRTRQDQLTTGMMISQSGRVIDGNQALEEFRRGSDHRWNQYHGIKYSSSLEQSGDDMARQLFHLEMEHAEALASLQLEAERGRQEVHTSCAKALSRHKLRSAGMSIEEVNGIIPE